jgi:hypothetical protein
MRKLVQRVVVLVLAVAVIAPSVALAGAPKYPKKDHPVLRQHKAERTAKKKAKAMEVKKGLFGLHG